MYSKTETSANFPFKFYIGIPNYSETAGHKLACKTSSCQNTFWVCRGVGYHSYSMVLVYYLIAHCISYNTIQANIHAGTEV